MQHPQHHGYNLRKRRLGVCAPEDEEDCLLREREKYNVKHEKTTREEWCQISWQMAVVVLSSFVTRLLYINSSPIVVWDEAHFGKFANWYLKGKFYFDVHPPFGKMLVAFSGYLFNYKGDFEFNSGSDYTTSVPILQMRAFCALFGAMAAPLMYGTCRNMNFSKNISFFVSMLIVCDNALLTISKFVLLDSILLCFTTLSLYAMTKLDMYEMKPFSKMWYKWLLFTGVSLGLTTSVKWVGLFTYAFAGCFSIKRLWMTLPVFKVKPQEYTKNLIIRAFFLIAIPMCVYMFTFYIHFAILTNSGTGDTQMSSRFGANLHGSNIRNGHQHAIIDKSIVTIRNRGHGGGLLHSHSQMYPSGSKQGQVTLYTNRDDNNKWEIKFQWNVTRGDEGKEPSDRFLKNGAVVRLVHSSTGRNLHSHQIPAPLSVYQNEVSGYGNRSIGDKNDYWVVETADVKIDTNISRLTSAFSLRHNSLGCYLGSSGERLPEWGFGQMEVVCTTIKSKRTQWNLEEIKDDRYDKQKDGGVDDDKNDKENIERNGVMTHFITDFIDLNMAMWYGNNALTPKLGKKDILISTPSQWPFMQVGIRMCNWGNETIKYYMLGNPMGWWLSSSMLVVFLALAGKHYVQDKMEGFIDANDEEFIQKGWMLFLGWTLHYVPFFLMGRVTYLHHYFPSFIISTLMAGHVLTKVERRSGRYKYLVICLTIAQVSTFIYFSPVSYGFIGKAEEMRGRVFRSSWNIIDS